jgi:hypothetical protein
MQRGSDAIYHPATQCAFMIIRRCKVRTGRPQRRMGREMVGRDRLAKSELRTGTQNQYFQTSLQSVVDLRVRLTQICILREPPQFQSYFIYSGKL